jgi:DNA polymerase III subunit epsilon
MAQRWRSEGNLIASHPLRRVSGVSGNEVHRFTVLDVETSGLSDRRHRILQIALVTVDTSGTIVDEWSSYAKPFLWHVGPRHVHGLSARQLRHEPRFSSLVPELVKRLDGSVLVAHNLDFDWPFLRRGLRRGGYAVPDALRLCTLRLSRSLDPDKQVRHRLGDLAARHGIELTNAHDALADARATAQVLPKLLSASPDPWRFADGTSTAWPAP